MSPATLSAALAAGAVAAALPPAAVRGRVGAFARVPPVSGHPRGPGGGRSRRPAPPHLAFRGTPAWHRAGPVVGGLGVGVVAGGPTGVVLGIVAALALVVVLRRGEPPEERALRERAAAELAMVADLLAACLECGAGPLEAIEVAAPAAGGPWPALLLPAASAIRLGADPSSAWTALSARSETVPLARVLARAVDEGVALSPLLRATAQESRRERRSRARVAAQRAGVLALGPLAACFLPAFVLVGVVPVVVSVGRAVLGGLG